MEFSKKDKPFIAVSCSVAAVGVTIGIAQLFGFFKSDIRPETPGQGGQHLANVHGRRSLAVQPNAFWDRIRIARKWLGRETQRLGKYSARLKSGSEFADAMYLSRMNSGYLHSSWTNFGMELEARFNVQGDDSPNIGKYDAANTQKGYRAWFEKRNKQGLTENIRREIMPKTTEDTYAGSLKIPVVPGLWTAPRPDLDEGLFIRTAKGSKTGFLISDRYNEKVALVISPKLVKELTVDAKIVTAIYVWGYIDRTKELNSRPVFVATGIEPTTVDNVINDWSEDHFE